MARKALMARGSLDKALQKLVQRGEWDKAHVERFRARVRDHGRGVRAPEGKARTTTAIAGGEDEKAGRKARRRLDD